MDNDFKTQAYELLKEFVRAISNDDRQELKKKFDISDALAEEIQEMIGSYYSEGKFSLGIAPFELAFSKEKSTRPNIDLFEMNESNRWGAECVLWNHNKPSEPILHVELFNEIPSLKLQYKYIGS